MLQAEDFYGFLCVFGKRVTEALPTQNGLDIDTRVEKEKRPPTPLCLAIYSHSRNWFLPTWSTWKPDRQGGREGRIHSGH